MLHLGTLVVPMLYIRAVEIPLLQLIVLEILIALP